MAMKFKQTKEFYRTLFIKLIKSFISVSLWRPSFVGWTSFLIFWWTGKSIWRLGSQDC